MIKKQIVVLAFFTFSLGNYCVAQKIKYKDLFYLLNAKKYDEAEPFLKSFLGNTKQANHPNANFQMAIICHEKSKTNDVLLDTEEKLINIDSAIHYYNRAKTLITEKEIKKRDEYYEAYYRRDLRTGKMGIKLSDIQLDIETKIEKLGEDKAHILALKQYYISADEYYGKAQQQYELLMKQFESQKQFLLRADEKIIEQLGQIKSDYDSSMGNFGRYKIEFQELESPTYKQTLKVSEIKDIKVDGLSKADFLKNNVEVWNYDQWVTKIVVKIKNEMLPLHIQLVDYDEKLNELYRKIQEDSMAVIDDLSTIEDFEMEAAIKEFDSDPFPFSLFALKKTELAYLSSKLELFEKKETLDIDKQFELTISSLKFIDRLDSIMKSKIIHFNLKNEALNYKSLIENQYGGVDGLTAFVKEKADLVINDRQRMEDDLVTLKEKSRWLIFEADSIPLFPRDLNNVITLNDRKTFVHFDTIKVNDTLRIAYGINYDFNGTPLMYFSRITPTHVVKLMNEFKIDTLAFSIDSLNSITVTKVSDRGANSYFLLHSTNYHNTPMKAHLFRVKNDMTLSWDKAITLLYPPDVLTISNDFGVLAINYNVNYIDKSNGLQLISRELFNILTGELIKDKK